MKVSPINFSMSVHYTLGLSFDYHDAAAALLKDGIVIAAAQEERFTRVKHDAQLPVNAVAYCLQEAGITIEQVDAVVYYEKPLLKFERLIKSYINTWPFGLVSFVKAMLNFVKTKFWVDHRIREELGYKGKIFYTEHHMSHAASAYYASGFNDATVVTMDGVGEFDTTTIGYGRDSELHITHTREFPHSLGMLYSAITYYLGFKVNSAEYKVMGLAPYGDPSKYYRHFQKLYNLAEDGSLELDMSYFGYESGLRMTNDKFSNLFGGPARESESNLGQREKDIAAALQQVTNEIVLKIVAHARNLHPSDRLCMAGGVALNCVANAKLVETGWFKEIYIQPAAGDAGGALGCAYYYYYHIGKNSLPATSAMPTVYLGPSYSDAEIEEFLQHGVREVIGSDKKVVYAKLPDRDTLVKKIAELINGTNVIGLMQGRMEFGPRALGNRSIIADARNKDNWQKVNLKIKFRESFRPFAPTVLADQAQDWFDLPCSSPYMLLVAPVKREGVPAITHVDQTARLQTVSREQNPLYYDIIKSFAETTGCPVIINTSFNVRSEPIVMSPRDAFNCFIHTFMDYLVMGNFIIAKKDNVGLVDEAQMRAYLGSFKLD